MYVCMGSRGIMIYGGDNHSGITVIIQDIDKKLN